MRLLERLFRLHGQRQDWDPDLDEALERAAEKIDPRVKQTRSWPQHYRVPLAGALAQARRVAEAIPGPIELDPANYTLDPFIRALFSNAEDVRSLLGSSPALRGYHDHHVYALLSMRRMEKRSLGFDNSGDILRRDVLQQLVWFTDHQLSGPAPSEAEARRQLLWSLYDRFLERVHIGIKRIEEDYQRLLRDKDAILARLRKATGQQQQDLQQALETTLHNLTDTNRTLEPSALADIFMAVLSHPRDCLYAEHYSLILDAMGVVQSGDNPAARQLEFTELHERYQEPRTLVVIHSSALRTS
jgi:hypothetical protein